MEPQIEPHRITKPIQLLAAWLAGLAIVNSSFLLGAAQIQTPSWLPALLAIAAVVNVPLFILSLFLLQTKFRPEMQEDTYYARYLEKRYSTQSPSTPPVDFEQKIRELSSKIIEEIKHKDGRTEFGKIEAVLKDATFENLELRFAKNRPLSELFLHSDKWAEHVSEWCNNSSFKSSVAELIDASLATIASKDYLTVQLTESGKELAKRLHAQKRLWHQKHKDAD